MFERCPSSSEPNPRNAHCFICAPRLFCITAWLALTLSASAIVSPSSGADTNAPTDGCPWANVGAVNGASGIYLGAGWVLTAAHVGAGNFSAGGVVFPFDGTLHRLTNSDGTAADMVLFHLRTVPSLPRLALASNSPAASAQVDLVGCGYIAGSCQTNIGLFTGFYWSGAGFKSWGNNKVSLAGITVNAGFGALAGFSMAFINPSTTGATSNEAQAAAGDSGGAVLQKTGSTWQLVGMVDAIGPEPGQPPNTAVYGETTYSANIAAYRVQIQSWIAATVPTLAVARRGPQMLLSWPDTGASYTLLSTANPLSSISAWSVLSPPLSASNGFVYASVPATNGLRLFRLKR